MTEDILIDEAIMQSVINATTPKNDGTSDSEDDVDETMHITWKQMMR